MARREPRTFARQQFRRDLRIFLRTNIRIVLGLAAGAAALVAFEALFFHGVLLGFIAGIVLTLLASAFFVTFLMHGSGFYRLAGAWAEEFTRDELKKALRRKDVWSVVNGVRIGEQDIDHLVLAPRGIFALDSKWHFRYDIDYFRADVEKAERAASKARSILISLKQRREVTPVVVVAGPGRKPLLDAPMTVADIEVIAIDSLAQWLQDRGTGRLPQDDAEQLAAELTAFRRAHAGASSFGRLRRLRRAKLWSKTEPRRRG